MLTYNEKEPFFKLLVTSDQRQVSVDKYDYLY